MIAAFECILWNQVRSRRGIDLTAAQKLIADYRLSGDIVPTSYALNLRPNIAGSTFNGDVKIGLRWKTDTKKIELHSHYDLKINLDTIKVTLIGTNES